MLGLLSGLVGGDTRHGFSGLFVGKVYMYMYIDGRQTGVSGLLYSSEACVAAMRLLEAERWMLLSRFV